MRGNIRVDKLPCMGCQQVTGTRPNILERNTFYWCEAPKSCVRKEIH